MTENDAASGVKLDRRADPANWPGGVRRLMREQYLRAPLDEVFPFFADAHNLEAITPAVLRFNVLTPKPIEMGVGARIEYKLSLRGFPMKWRTQIVAWEPGVRFVDLQVKGPYRLWHHEHTFQQVGDGTLCRDIVHYSHWGTPLGERLLVRPDIEGIFDYRYAEMAKLFGGWVPDEPVRGGGSARPVTA